MTPAAPALRWWMPLALAVQFLTRVPIPGLRVLTADTAKLGLARAVAWFPLVGGLVGLLTACVMLLIDPYWRRPVAVILALIFEARLTGAFHEDAVADFCDGFGGGIKPERIHSIMKDSRIGSYGALGLGLAVGLRAVLLISLPAPLILPALVASASFGRWMAVAVMALVPPLSHTEGLAKDVGARSNLAQLAAASLLTVPFIAALGWMLPGPMIGGLAAAVIFLLWFRRFLLRNLGGVTGDCLGFAVYVGQLVMLLAATLHLA